MSQAMVQNVLSTVGDLCEQYHISSLEDFLESCRTFAEESTLNIAILGRFKAGKSSFLNHLLGRELLPVGVIPVTAVVTEIQYGPRERTLIQFLDGASEEVAIGRTNEFVSETNNPENAKRVLRRFCRVYKKSPIRCFADHLRRRDHVPSDGSKISLAALHVITLGETFTSDATAVTSGLPLEVSMDDAATTHKDCYGMLEGVVAERYWRRVDAHSARCQQSKEACSDHQ